MKSLASDKQIGSKKKGEEENDLDVEALLDDLKHNILQVCAIHPDIGKDLQELKGKQPINILHEIELEINTNIKEMSYIINNKDEPSWKELVRNQEIIRKEVNFNERKKLKDEAERIIKL